MAKKKETPKKTSAKTARSSSGKAVKKIDTKKKPVAKASSSKTVKVAAKKVSSKPATKAVKKETKKASPKPKAIKDANQLLADAVVEGILEKKGKNISVLNLKNIHNRVCDYFIICQADSTTQVNAVAGSVEEIVKKRIGENPYRAEGFENSEWVLIDYVTVVVHVFQSEMRNFYNLESLWADAEITEIAFD